MSCTGAVLILPPILLALQLRTDVSPTVAGDIVNEPSFISVDKLYVSACSSRLSIVDIHSHFTINTVQNTSCMHNVHRPPNSARTCIDTGHTAQTHFTINNCTCKMLPK